VRRAWLHWVEAAGQPRSRGVLPLAGTYLAVDSLAGLFTVVAGAVVAAVAVYGIGYAAGHGAHGLGSRTAQMVLPLFALTLVLVLAEHRERASVRPAGVWYVVMTHLGLVLLLAGFALFATEAGDESFITLRALPDPARLKAIGEDIREIAGLAFGHSTVRDRFTGTASLHKAAGRQIGCLGYVARAGGLAADARISHPFTAYSAGLDVPVQDNGDVLARFLVRAEEIETPCPDRPLRRRTARSPSRVGTAVRARHGPTHRRRPGRRLARHHRHPR